MRWIAFALILVLVAGGLMLLIIEIGRDAPITARADTTNTITSESHLTTTLSYHFWELAAASRK